jgi:ribosomal 30S subunit maturation factor RimM
MPAMATRKHEGRTNDSDWVGFDVMTSAGHRVGIVEDICRIGAKGVGTCLLLARRTPHGGEQHFLLPLKELVFDPIQHCLLWDRPEHGANGPVARSPRRRTPAIA